MTEKLTKIQLQVLELLEQGAMMVIDAMNMASIGDRNIAPQTRYFLTNSRLVTRKDKTKAITTSGNGYVISKKGIQALLAHRTEQKSA